MAQGEEMVAARSSSRASRYPTAPPVPERQPTLARSLMNKSSRLLARRKSTPKLRAAANVSAFANWDDDEDEVVALPPHSPTVLQKSPPPPAIRKDSISTPYNFQHLTHTNRTHARTLQGTRKENLITEFCAHRAAQKARPELKGIKAEDLPSPLNSEVVSLASPRTTSPRQSPVTSRPTTPARYGRGLKTSKSVDHLRPMAHRSFSAPLTTVAPPPRTSSRKPTNLANVMIDMDPLPRPLDSPTLPTPDTAATARSPASYGFPTPVSTPATSFSYEESAEIAQAMTTPDDSACEMTPRPKQGSVSTLSDMPGTDESGAKKSDRVSQQSLRHIKSMPSVKHFSRSFTPINWGSQTSLNTTDPTLPSPGRAQDDVPTGPMRRLSLSQPKAQHESWEDSVDYCYDFAMDENEDGLTMGAGAATSTPAMTGSANSSAVSFLETSLPSASLPYALSPSLLATKEYSSRVTHEEQYAQRLSEEGEEDFKSLYNYSFYFHSGLDDAAPPSASSPRSSRSGGSRHAPLSKSSSQDSFASRYSASEAAPHILNKPAAPASRLLRSKPSREHLGLLTENGTSLPSAIDSMRQDLIRAAEAMPDAAFDDAMARTMSPTPTPTSQSPSRIGHRRGSHDDDCIPEDGPVANFTRPTPAPRYTGGRDAPSQAQTQQQRARAASAASVTPRQFQQRVPHHRTSYSLFPQVVRA